MNVATPDLVIVAAHSCGNLKAKPAATLQKCEQKKASGFFFVNLGRVAWPVAKFAKNEA